MRCLLAVLRYLMYSSCRAHVVGRCAIPQEGQARGLWVGDGRFSACIYAALLLAPLTLSSTASDPRNAAQRHAHPTQRQKSLKRLAQIELQVGEVDGAWWQPPWLRRARGLQCAVRDMR